MPLYDLASNTDVRNQEDFAKSLPFDQDRDNTPSFFQGSAGAAGQGMQAGVLNLMNLGAEAAHKTGLINDENLKTFSDAFIDVKKQLLPSPQVTGLLGKILYPATTMLTEAVPSTLLGGPLVGASVTGAAEGVAQKKELVAEGVDKSTANKVATITGATAGLSVLLPAAIPGKIATRIASGAGINISVGAAQRGITGKTLRDNGYGAMAEQYKVLDSTSIITDAILGSAFGALHTSPKIKDPLPSSVDTALAANNVHQLELDAAPGIPTDMQTRNSHIEAITKGLEQVHNNEPVEIGKYFDDPNFLYRNENPEIMDAMQEAIIEHGLPDLESTPPHDFISTDELVKPVLKSEVIPFEKKPLSLLDWISKNGGIKDIGGDLNHINSQDWHKGRPFVKRLIQENGLNPDDIALKAWEEGYFTSHGENRPTINDLYEKIDSELRGNRQYPNDFIANAAEDPDYVDYLAERMSQAQSDRLNLEIAGHHEVEYARILKEEEQWAGSRGDAWEPDELESITLEDLENERRQEDLASEAQKSADVNEQQGSPTGVERSGKEGVPNDRGVAESARSKSEEGAVDNANIISTEKPGLKIINEEGNVVTASEALTKANEELDRAKKESNLFDVAVNCFIRNGS